MKELKFSDNYELVVRSALFASGLVALYFVLHHVWR